MGGAEEEFVREAFASNYIAPIGPMVDAFEREFAEYTGIPYCLALSSGTAAMHLALREVFERSEVGGRRADDLRPIVLASTLTFIGSVTPATFVGCELRFIDCDRESWNMDPLLLEAELADCAGEGREVLAVVPTDLYGQCCNLLRIKSICDRHGVPVICDSAEAMGAGFRPEAGVSVFRCFGVSEVGQPSTDHAQPPTANCPQPTANRHAGFGAWASVYSFNGNKIITTSGGGMLASHDKELIDHARKLSTQARDPAPWYEHTEIGYNYRMSNIVAAIGRGQLQVLDERVRRKHEIFAAYQRHLADVPGVSFMPEPEWSSANRWLTVILIDPKEFGADTHAVREALERENIESRPVWKPMHLQPVFKDCRVRGGAVSEKLFAQGLCLPSGTAMSDEDVQRVVRAILDVRSVFACG
jgi:dTDP-4-amino-4,6-dideoxygalactose transaminase